MSFEWFRFRGLTIDEFESVVSVNPDYLEYFYSRWVHEYQRSVVLFMNCQYAWHRQAEFKEFTRHFNLHLLTEYDLECYPDYYPDWKEWQENSESLQSHRSALRAETSKGRSSGGLTSLKDYSLVFMADMQNGWNDEQIDRANAAWFDANIPVNSFAQIQQFRKLPYVEYLQTSHWKRIRSAILLINKAHCKDCDASGSGESYYGGGWEAELQVHHLHYKNFGKERYRDLALVCDQHHHARHQVEVKL